MKTLITTLLAATALTAVSGGAMAADLAMPAAAAPAMAAPAPTNWDGPYIGASVGYGWGTADGSDTSTATFHTTANPTGFLIGAQIGYNFHLSDNIVAGIEGNVDWVDENGNFNNGDSSSAIHINWEGSIRGRLGYDAGQFLPYIEAGVAFANINDDWSETNGVNTGWTVGAGVEFALADNLSANLEYRYSDYGTLASGTEFPDHVTDSTVRIGLNYHF